ncbi:MAG: sulfatase [Planctomycetes bacterium]|nr:sulfatase [Planctomycetota bacterium]
MFLATCLTAVVVSATEPVTRPNVLFIAVDDLNDWIGCLEGHPQTKTPNIDRLANRGVLFTRSYCAAPACNPSRAALLTGIRPSTSGVYYNAQSWRKALPNAVTLPQLFMKHGYRVVGGGKIYHGRFPDPASWHEYFKRGSDPKPKKVPANGIPKTAHFDWGPVPDSDEAMSDFRVTSWAISELQKKHDKPFFLACGLFRPHLPWYAPQKYFDMFPADEIQLPKILKSDLSDIPPLGVKMAKPTGDHRKVTQSNNHRRAVQGYLASIAFADAQIGRLLDALDNSPHSANTIVILWGDHGWHLGEKLHWRKFALWEEATKAPLMITVPGVTKPKSRCDRPVSFMDIYPTLADLCDLPVGDHLEGKSLRPLLDDPTADWDRPAVTTHGRNNHAVRSERWRYIRYSDGTEELYDHEADPLEWHNLASDEKFDAIRQQLAAWLPKKNVSSSRSTGR